MNLLFVLPYYLVWHYGRAYSDIKSVWTNFLVFIYHFFSIPLLLRTLFSPWQRMQDSYGPQSALFETFIFNIIMRCVGFAVRVTFIIIGAVFLIALVLFGIAFYFIWIFMPFILAVFALWGIKELII